MTRTPWWRRILGRERADEDVMDQLTPKSKREAKRLERERARGVDAPRRRQHITEISEGALNLICEAAKSTHPNEFGATLRGEEGRITEVLLVPGTIGGSHHAILPLFSMPIDASIVGTVHSHPGPSAEPSDADLQLFRQHGHTHIIIHEPYTFDTWVAYDMNGRPLELEIVEF
jgi:proteasome lid subunit RPN8/RPN11